MTYDQLLAALCLWREARSESAAARAGVFYVILNRARDPRKRWKSTVHGVVTQPWQFSSFNQSDHNVIAWPSEEHPAEWTAWQECLAVVTSTLIEDPTRGANSYHSFSDPKQFPKWADESKLTVQIGAFRFYAL